MKNLFFILFTMSFWSLNAQHTMHDFTVTDTDGQEHKLYDDFLNQGKVVAIKFFFSSCPPCNQAAPQWRQKHIQWSSQDVSFFTVTTITSDNNPQVNGFRTNHNLGMPGISHEGGAPNIANPFKTNTYGSWFGTPSYAVIAPNGRLFYPVFMSNFDATIQMAKNETSAPPTVVNLSLNAPNFQLNPNHVKFYIHPQDNPSQKIEITQNNHGQYEIDYPSAIYPRMTNPVVTMESIGPAYISEVRASDIVAVQKHLLDIEPFEFDYQHVAADANGDGRLTAIDMVIIRSVILDLIQVFPNNTPSYKMIPEYISVTETPGQTLNLDLMVIKIGNVR